jgi:hypothetical protein
VDDLSAAKERLRKAGIEVDGDGYLEGPDRIRIELVASDQKTFGRE